MSQAPTSWFVRPVSRPSARVRLVCFPSAGSGASGYFPWARELPPTVELWALQLPGREGRYAEAPLTQWSELAEVLVREAHPLAAGLPTVFFGHSMGAYLAAQVASRLPPRAHSVVKLFLAGANGPLAPDNVHLLECEETAPLLDAVMALGGTPREVLAHPELTEMVLQVLKSDLALVRSVREAQLAPLVCEVEAWFGTSDMLLQPPDPMSWAAHTAAGYSWREFPGDHFFIRDARAGCFQHLVDQLARWA